MALPIDPASLASLASLQGTLSSGDILSLSEALNQRAMAEAQRRTAQATQEASQAGQAFQQAAADPVQTPDALASMLPLLTGNIASVIAQDPSFAKRGAEEVGKRREDLARTRSDNLIALKDNYDKKALLAAHLGDNETEMDMRQRSEQLSKTLEVLLANQHEAAAKENIGLQQAGRMKQIEAQGANQVKAAAVRANATETPDLSDFTNVRTMGDGSKVAYLDPEEMKNLTPKAKQALTIAARKSGVVVPSAQHKDATDLIDTVRGDIQNVRDNYIPLLPTGSGLKRTAQGLMKQGEAFLQTPGEGSKLAAYPAIRTAAIKTIQAIASLGKGLRINQAEINAAMNFDYPRITDNQETAQNKLDILSTMLDHVERAAMGTPPTDAEVSAVLKAIRDLKSGTAPRVIRYDKKGNRLN